MAIQTHALKTWPQYFDAVASGDKTFEVRRDDRGFQKGDELVLRRWRNDIQCYDGQEVRKVISYILTGGQFGVEPGFVVLGLAALNTEEPRG